MAWDGLGNFEEPDAPEFPALPGDIIRAEYYNSVIRALCEGFSNTMPRDGQATATGDFDMGNIYTLLNIREAIMPGMPVRFQEFEALVETVEALSTPVEPFLYKNAGVI